MSVLQQGNEHKERVDDSEGGAVQEGDAGDAENARERSQPRDDARERGARRGGAQGLKCDTQPAPSYLRPDALVKR